MDKRTEPVLTRDDELEIENRALRAEVKRLNRDLQAAFDDACRAASEASSPARRFVTGGDVREGD